VRQRKYITRDINMDFSGVSDSWKGSNAGSRGQRALERRSRDSPVAEECKDRYRRKDFWINKIVGNSPKILWFRPINTTIPTTCHQNCDSSINVMFCLLIFFFWLKTLQQQGPGTMGAHLGRGINPWETVPLK